MFACLLGFQGASTTRSFCAQTLALQNCMRNEVKSDIHQNSTDIANKNILIIKKNEQFTMLHRPKHNTIRMSQCNHSNDFLCLNGRMDGYVPGCPPSRACSLVACHDEPTIRPSPPGSMLAILTESLACRSRWRHSPPGSRRPSVATGHTRPTGYRLI